MPPKQATPAVERVIPYDLRKTRIPRVAPSTQPDHPAGDYLPSAASKRIHNMKQRAAARGHPTKLPPLVKKLRKEGREEARRNLAAAADPPPPPARLKNVNRPKNAAPKRVQFACAAAAGVIPSDPPLPPAPSSDPQSSSDSSVASSDEEVENEVGEDEQEDLEAEEAAVQDLYHSKERLKRIVHTNRISAARRDLRDAREASIATSELEEEIAEQMKHSGDYSIIVSVVFRLNKKRLLSKTLPETTRYTFDILAFEEAFLASIEPYLGDQEFEFTARTAVMKHASGRGGSRRHDIEEFSITEGERILEIVDQHRANFRKGQLLVIFEISVAQDPKAVAAAQRKRSRKPVEVDSDVLSSSPPPQPERKRISRGDRLQEQHATRLDAIRIAGDFQKQLMERWRCREENCTNKNNYCFIEPTDSTRHYNITAAQHEMWANSIGTGEATVQCPPLKLLRFWESEQGSISRLSRRPAKQTALQQASSAMERLAEMQVQMQEQMMNQRVFDQMEALEEKQERREERNERRQMQREQRELQSSLQNTPFSGYMMPPQVPMQTPVYMKPFTSTYGPATCLNNGYTAGLTPGNLPAAPAAPTVRQRYSSPINAEEEDAEILAMFFHWKISMTKNSDRRMKWQHAQEIVSRNDWSIQELQQMEDGVSAMYQRAIKAGISDGFARGFRAEIHLFKGYYQRLKETEVAATPNGRGGGFIPEGSS